MLASVLINWSSIRHALFKQNETLRNLASEEIKINDQLIVTPLGASASATATAWKTFVAHISLVIMQ